ncbi:hypothetical protein SCP_1502190 [Sparassis crispa]|uniref:Uncharacterized protein n=1 Tax=Sparassis crispa TaxID=139825 RepID=A0A401H485_9APHY|nr:hypothetical protein SCP_1502190 [Sparassis crispa]GBE89211.1 hypothetical protein SCP_1502190 [Sparassis crispa]
MKRGDEEAERWRRLLVNHKELAEKMHNLLQLTLAPAVPSSLCDIPTKYNIIMHLWTTTFNRLLQSLRRASMPPVSSEIAREGFHLPRVHVLHWESTISLSFAPVESRCSDDEHILRASGGRLTVSAIATASAIAASHSLDTPWLATRNASALSDHPEIPSVKRASPTPAAPIDDSPPSSQLNDGPNANANANIPSVGLAAARMNGDGAGEGAAADDR